MSSSSRGRFKSRIIPFQSSGAAIDIILHRRDTREIEKLISSRPCIWPNFSTVLQPKIAWRTSVGHQFIGLKTRYRSGAFACSWHLARRSGWEWLRKGPTMLPFQQEVPATGFQPWFCTNVRLILSKRVNGGKSVQATRFGLESPPACFKAGSLQDQTYSCLRVHWTCRKYYA